MHNKKTLAEWRRERGLTQIDLALRAGISLSTVVNTEAGRQTVHFRTARRLADALGVSLDEIAWPEIVARRARSTPSQP